MISRRGFMTTIAALAGVGTAGGESGESIESADWSLTCESGVCVVAVYGRVQPASERRDATARIQLSEDCAQTASGVVQPGAHTYCVVLITTYDGLVEDTTEVLGVEVTGGD